MPTHNDLYLCSKQNTSDKIILQDQLQVLNICARDLSPPGWVVVLLFK